jgi:serine/threonine protein kinase
MGCRVSEDYVWSAMKAQVIDRDRLGSLTKIGQGGQGVVYRAPNVKTKFAASMVYKEYKAQGQAAIDFTTLAAMPALVEDSLSYIEAERLISIAAWPCRIVEHGGAPTGFVMPAIPDEFFIPLTTVKGISRATAEFQHLLNHPSILLARGIALDDVQRYALLREVASGLAFMHKHGVCVGDISPKNLLFSLTPPEAVYFIDCDAMRINGVSALPQVQTPGWDTPPREELATIYSDSYKLGLLALRLMTGEQDTKSPEHLPSATPTLLRQIITDTLNNAPEQRPLPEAWIYVLGHAIEEAQHRKKTPPPVTAAPAPPPQPKVRSRPPTGSSAPRAPQPRPAHRPYPQIATPKPPRERRKVNRRTAIAVLAVPVVVCVAAVVFAGATLRLYLADRTVADAKREIVQTETNAMTTLWTYTPEDVNTLADRASRYLSGDFEAKYRKFVDAIAVPDKQAQVTSTAQVLGAGVVSLSGPEATAVIYVNTTSTTPQTRDKPSTKYFSYRVTLEKHDSRWLIMKMTTITSMDVETKKLPGAG